MSSVKAYDYPAFVFNNGGLDMIFNFDVNITEFYMYRSAITTPTVIITLTQYDTVCLKNFVETQGYKLDNHISFKTDNNICFTYTDCKLYIGTSMEVKSW